MANEILKRHGWNLRRALDYYYDNRHRYPQAKNQKKGDKKKLAALFDKYAGNSPLSKPAMWGLSAIALPTPAHHTPTACAPSSELISHTYFLHCFVYR